MARPTKTDTDSRGEIVTFRLRPDELAAVDDRARRAGLRRSDYLRRMALRGRITVRPTARPDFELVAAINRIGVNLNQMTRTANQTGSVPPEVRRLCQTIEKLVAQAAEQG